LKKDFLNELALMNVRKESKKEVLEEEMSLSFWKIKAKSTLKRKRCADINSDTPL
jgi:hypothetical protein